MKRICFFLAILFMFSYYSILSFAINTPTAINSPLRAPEVSFVQESGHYIYKFYGEYYDDHNYTDHDYQLFVYVITTTSSDLSIYYGLNSSMGNLVSSSEFSYDITTYDAQTGGLFEHFTGVSSQASSSQWALAPSDKPYYKFTFRGGSSAPVHLVVPDNVSIIQRQSGNLEFQVDNFINFKANIETKVRRSYLSEPVADPLNKYIILAGQDVSYLFWINIKCDDFDVLSYSWDIEIDDPNVSDFVNYNEYLKCKSFFTPKLIFSSNGGASLYLSVDNDILQYFDLIYSNQATLTQVINYDILISKFDLSTGEYIDSVKHSDFSVSPTEFLIDSSFFGSSSDYDAIKIYDINFENNSSNQFNLLSCVWGVDPSFETWKNDMINYIEGIYNAVVGTDNQYPTDPAVSNEVSQYQQLESELMKNKSVELQSALDQGNQALDNNAFAFIRNTMQILVFDNPKLSIFIVFALGMGLIVLVLGRKVSSI